MKKLVILGAGAGGCIIANKMRQKLDEKEWKITIIDRNTVNHYQPGWLFVPFGIYDIKDCIRPLSNFIPQGVDFVNEEITNVDPVGKVISTTNGKYDYDWIVVATGCRIMPDEIEGMMDGWKKNIHTFYTPDGAVDLCHKLARFEKGKICLNIAEMPIKCPVAPLEWLFLADWFFMMEGTRHQIEIELITPLTGAFTKPVAAAALGKICEEKNIKIVPNFEIAAVDAERGVMESMKGDEVEFDLLVAIPPNFGSQVLLDSDISDPMGYMKTDNYTLKSPDYENMYILGYATNVPASKAGSVTHFEADVLVENLHRDIEGITIKTMHNNDFVTVRISDTGTGVPEALTQRIFEPFFTPKQVGKGTGLGLSISYGIVKESGGTIHVMNNEEGGASFFIRLPVAGERPGGGE